MKFALQLYQLFFLNLFIRHDLFITSKLKVNFINKNVYNILYSFFFDEYFHSVFVVSVKLELKYDETGRICFFFQSSLRAPIDVMRWLQLAASCLNLATILLVLKSVTFDCFSWVGFHLLMETRLQKTSRISTYTLRAQTFLCNLMVSRLLNS